MAVFSIIKLSELEGAKRIDAEYYKPEYLWVKSLHNAVPLRKIINDIRYGLYVEPEYKETGINFIRALNLLCFWIDGEVLKIEENKVPDDYKLNVGDCLIVRSGANTGSVGFVFPIFQGSTFGSYTIKISFNKINPAYGTIFLASKYGLSQAVRLKTGSAQLNLNIPNILQIKVPVLSEDVQKEIENIVWQVYELQQFSQSIYSQAENFLLEELGLKDFKPKYEKTYTAKLSDAFSAHRIDAEYFQPAYEEVIEKIKNYKNGFDRLLKHVENIKPNFDPTKYPDKIFSYIELADIDSSIGVIHSVNKVKGGEAPSRARRLLKEGDVIVSSVEGSLEKVALIDREHDACLASTGFFQFRPLDILPEVLLVLSKTIILQLQLKKRCSGTILTAVPKESLIDIIIPLLPFPTQQEIASLVKQSHEARKEAKELLEVAKKAVEIAIEEGEEKAKIYLLNHRIKNEFI
jgi:restriction endonuclease S subunit